MSQDTHISKKLNLLGALTHGERISLISALLDGMSPMTRVCCIDSLRGHDPDSVVIWEVQVERRGSNGEKGPNFEDSHDMEAILRVEIKDGELIDDREKAAIERAKKLWLEQCEYDSEEAMNHPSYKFTYKLVATSVRTLDPYTLKTSPWRLARD